VLRDFCSILDGELVVGIHRHTVDSPALNAFGNRRADAVILPRRVAEAKD
jgi:hypothetical protein